MKLAVSPPKRNRPLEFLKGIVKTTLSGAMIWVGFNSLLIGIAYKLEKGSGAARFVGAFVCAAGLLLLWKSIRQVARSLSDQTLEDDDA